MDASAPHHPTFHGPVHLHVHHALQERAVLCRHHHAHHDLDGQLSGRLLRRANGADEDPRGGELGRPSSA